MLDTTSQNRNLPERDESGRLLPGSTANPHGRPKGTFSLVEMIKKRLQEIPEGKDKTYAEYFIEQMMKKTVAEGDVPMMRDIINRVDGLPRQQVDVTSLGEKLPSVSLDLKTLIDGSINDYLKNPNSSDDSSGE